LNKELDGEDNPRPGEGKKVDAGLIGEYVISQKKKVLARIEEKEELFLLHKVLACQY
jgi:hypothetical protein